MFWLTLIYFYNTWQGSSEAERKAGVLQEQFPAPPAPNPAWAPTPKTPVGTRGAGWELRACQDGWMHPGQLVLPELLFGI